MLLLAVDKEIGSSTFFRIGDDEQRIDLLSIVTTDILGKLYNLAIILTLFDS